MSAQFKTAIPVDLSRPPHTEPLPHQLALKDSDSFVLTALVYDSSAAEPTEVMAGTVTGAALRPDGATAALRPDGATAALTGEKGAELVTVTDAHGNAWKATPCSVTVSQQALLHPGRVILSVKLTDDGDTTTVLTASFTVNRTNSDQIVDGGDVIITIDTLIGEIEDAAADAAQAKADAEAAAAAAESPVSYAAQTLTDAQKAQARTNIAAVGEDDLADLFMEPWQLMVKKYGIKSGDSTFEVRRNRLIFKPASDATGARIRVLVGTFAVRSSNLSSYTPVVGELIPVSVFGSAIKMAFYVNSNTEGRYPRFCYKFCTVDGETVTPVSGAYGTLPNTAANNTLVEQTVAVPEGATHVFFGLLSSYGHYAGTYDMVYKVDRADAPVSLMMASPTNNAGGDE